MQDQKLRTNQNQNSTQVKLHKELPPIPDKLYFTIGEVSKLCVLEPYVLRYWEQEFSQLKPVKRRSNRRYYQRKDIILIRQIRNLLYGQGFTIAGARVQMNRDNTNNDTTMHNAKEFIKNAINNLENLLVDMEGV